MNESNTRHLQRVMRPAVKHLVKLWAGRQYRERGVNFATLPELRMICADPLAFLDLIGGHDAQDILELALDWGTR